MNRALWLATPVLALALLPSNVVATALPILRQEWDTSATAIGWVFAAYQVGYVGAVLLLLPATDRFAPGLVIAVCFAATAAASLLFPLLADGVWSAAALRAVAGAGLAGVYLPGVRIVAAATPPERRGSAVGIYVSAFYLGSAISLWATGALLGVVDWRGAALVLALTCAAGLPAAALLARGSPRAVGERRSALLRPAVLEDGPMRRTILAYAGHSWELYVTRAWLAAFLAALLGARGLCSVEAAAEGGKWAAYFVGAGTLGVWLGGRFSDRVGRARAALGFAAASGVISLGVGLADAASWTLLVVVGCVYGLLLAADSAIYSTAVTELARPGQLGSAQAVQAFVGFLASSISPVAAGLVLDLGGGFTGVFILAGCASLAGALALRPLAR